MSAEEIYSVLFIEDDPETIQQAKDWNIQEIGGHPIRWTYTEDFEEGMSLIGVQRFDVVVTDIYRDRKSGKKNIAQGDAVAPQIVKKIRNTRFSPVVVFSDGTLPEGLVDDPLVAFVDKSSVDFSKDFVEALTSLISTGIPGIAKRLHDDIDKFTASYVWNFYLRRQQELPAHLKKDSSYLERIIRHRAALHLNLVEADQPRESATSADYYVIPPIRDSLKLGSILRLKGTEDYRIVLTPHCHLVTQPGDDKPKADYVLTSKALPATSLTHAEKWKKDAEKNSDRLRRIIGIPGQLGKPAGRYCFLPSMLDIPDLYCDLMQTETIPYAEWSSRFEHIADLDSPYAEAIQSSFSRFYSSVGTDDLSVDDFHHLVKVPSD